MTENTEINPKKALSKAYTNTLELPNPKKAKDRIKVPEAKQLIPGYKKYGLRLKELKFVAEYITNGFNAVQAYINSGYKAKNYRNCGILGSKMFERPGVIQAVQDHIDRWMAEKKIELNEKIIDVLYCQAFYDPAMFITPRGKPRFENWEEIPEKWRCCIEGITTKAYGKDALVQLTEISLVSRERSLERLAKFLTIFKIDETDVPVRLSKDTEERLSALFNGTGSRNAVA